MSRHSYLFSAVALLALATPAAAQRARADRDPCRDDGGDDHYERYCDARNLGWHANGRAIVADASPNGGVSVSAWDRDSVDVVAAVHARAATEDAARELASQVAVSVEGGTLHADGPEGRHRSWWVSFYVRVPAHSDLTLETVNGPLAVDGVSGTMDLRADNGPITLDEIGGDVHARAQNGPLTVSLAGSAWTGRGLDAETVNGPAQVYLPEGYNAELETGTVNGPMDIGMPLTVTLQGGYGAGRRQRIHTTLGRGGPLIRVVTTNGPASIRRMP